MASFIKSREENPISNSLQDALIYFNRQTIEEGKLYSRRYYSDSAKTSVDVVFAIGILPGVGPSCYSIVSHSKRTVVWGVSDSLPDVSEVTLGRLYIYWEPNQGKSYIVYLSHGNRIVEPITFPLIVFNSADSHLYYVSEKSIVDIYEHLDGIFELENRISALEKQLKEFIENSTTTTPIPEIITTTPAPVIPEETTTTTTVAPSIELVISSFSSTLGTQFELGQPIIPKLTWSYNIPIDSQKINGVEIDPNLRSAELERISSDTTYTLETIAGNTKKTKTVSLNFSAKSYLGSSETVEISDINSQNFKEIFGGLDMKEEGLSNLMCVGTVTKTFTFTSRSSLLFAFPKNIADKLVIIDSSINSPVNCTLQNLTITNDFDEEIEYTLFESPAVYATGTVLTWIFKF